MTIKQSPSELMQLNLLTSVCDECSQSSLLKCAAITNTEGRITNRGRNPWGKGFIQDYQAVVHVEILPKVPVYSLRPTASFCNEAAVSFVCPEGPMLPGQHRVVCAHICCLGIPGQKYWRISIKQHMRALQWAPSLEVMA